MKSNLSRTNIDRHIEDKVRRLVLQMAGQRLPSERDLAEDLEISRPRLRTILASLRQEGLIEQRIGSGTYALAPDKDRLQRVAILIDERLKIGNDPFISYLFESLQDNLQSEGARCMIERVGESDSSYRLEDGAIALGLAGRSVIDGLKPTDPPVVGLMLGSDVRPKRRASIFLLEDRQAGVTAAEFLVRKGCRRVYFIGRSDIPSSRERFEGVEQTLAGFDIPLTFIESHLSYSAGLKLGLEWDIPVDDGTTGLIATNDWLAVGLRAGMRRHDGKQREPVLQSGDPTDAGGDAVPSQSPPSGGGSPIIVSFDGLPVASDRALDIHSLAVPIQAIASDAVRELRSLSSSPISVGRLVRYPLAWAAESKPVPRASDIGSAMVD